MSKYSPPRSVLSCNHKSTLLVQSMHMSDYQSEVRLCKWCGLFIIEVWEDRDIKRKRVEFLLDKPDEIAAAQQYANYVKGFQKGGENEQKE